MASTNTGHFLVCYFAVQSQQPVTFCLRKEGYHSCHTDKVYSQNSLNACKFWAVTTDGMTFSIELARACDLHKQHSSLHSIFWSFIGLWLKLGHRNLLLTKAALITSLNLLIILWSLFQTWKNLRSNPDVLNWIPCKAADLNQGSALEMGIF